jgi:hypothetical protein
VARCCKEIAFSSDIALVSKIADRNRLPVSIDDLYSVVRTRVVRDDHFNITPVPGVETSQRFKAFTQEGCAVIGGDANREKKPIHKIAPIVFLGWT